MKLSNLISKTAGIVCIILAFIGSVYSKPQTGPNRTPLRQDQAQKDGAPKQPNAPANLNEAQLNRLIISRLDLTQEQRQRIRQIQRSYQPLLKSANEDIQQKRRALYDALYSDTYDEAVVTQRTTEFADAQAAVIRLRFKQESEFRQVLTPDQVRQFRKMRDLVQTVQGARQNKPNPASDDPGRN
ncbi:MAG TPA: periplasmic heavy metal sensor [Blastocatellia bacterium]|nr:periplasmic heavy metal sensor [Blastocatellia bacterium]